MKLASDVIVKFYKLIVSGRSVSGSVVVWSLFECGRCLGLALEIMRACLCQ